MPSYPSEGCCLPRAPVGSQLSVFLDFAVDRSIQTDLVSDGIMAPFWARRVPEQWMGLVPCHTLSFP